MSRPILTSKAFGGTGGAAWDDNIVSHSPTIVGIRKIDIRAGNQVDSIQVTYLCVDGSLYAAPVHGGSGGSLSTITLASDEHIVRVDGRTNNVLIDQLTFTSRHADGTERKHGPYGQTGKEPFSTEGYILGFNGQAGDLLDGLGVFYLAPLVKSQHTAGGTGGNKYDDNVDSMIPPVVGIKNLVVHSGNQVDSIQCTFLQLGGSQVTGNINGGNGGVMQSVPLKDDEVIVRMEGKTNGKLVDQFTLRTERLGNSYKHGPYGKTGKTAFEFPGKILGFYGTASNLMDSVGVYTVSEKIPGK